MTTLKLELIPDETAPATLDALLVGMDFAPADDWPQWLKDGWREEEPISDGTIPAGMVVRDEDGGGLRIGAGHGNANYPETARWGDYLIRDNKTGNLGAATKALLFSKYREIEKPAAVVV